MALCSMGVPHLPFSYLYEDGNFIHRTRTHGYRIRMSDMHNFIPIGITHNLSIKSWLGHEYNVIHVDISISCPFIDFTCEGTIFILNSL